MRNLVRALILSGSPRQGNSDAIAELAAKTFKELGVSVEVLKLRELQFDGCRGCRACIGVGTCVLEDDFTRMLAPKLLQTDILVIVTPVFFDNVSHLVKKFIDRTWCLRGRLRNVVGGAIVVGRGYGLDLAIASIHSFMLKHEMILCHRGVRFRAFDVGEAMRDEAALKDLDKLIHRLVEVAQTTACMRSR